MNIQVRQLRRRPVLVVLACLATGLVVAVPASAGPSGSAANGNQPAAGLALPVTVANGASNPVPVLPQGTTTVGGTVNVGNLPATQRVAGTVDIGNPVQVVPAAPRDFFNAEAYPESEKTSPPLLGAAAFFKVPAGKVAVIETVSADVRTCKGILPLIRLYSIDDKRPSNLMSHSIDLDRHDELGDDAPVYTATYSVHITVTSGSDIRAFLDVYGSASGCTHTLAAQATVSISGYFDQIAQ